MEYWHPESGEQHALASRNTSEKQPANETPSLAAIQTWFITHISDLLGIEPNTIDIRAPFSSYGLSSKDAVILSGMLETWLKRQLSPTLVYEYPSIAALARYLAEGTEGTDSSEAQLEVSGNRGTAAEPIAIIGIGCRFPGADDPQAFWQLLRAGVDAITEVPTERWDLGTFYDPDPAVPGKTNTRWGGFLKQVEHFDPSVFGIAPREVVRMDPQQRLLLEVAWEALEDAGQVLEHLAGTRTGVFIGISGNDYGQLQFGDPDLSDSYAGTGNALSIAANRLSYVFGLRGPSMAVDTACSSALVATHLACNSLRHGECTLALVGGVNVILSPMVTVNFTKAGFMAPDGRCKTFDADANGYVRSEGAGVVILKPLAQALTDGDPIYAVIRGSSVNQDGRTNGLTAPSRQAQEGVLRQAYQRAGISPGQVQYVEAHGTGTALGDPIEALALGTVLATDRLPDHKCAIGSVKTNIGHLEAAAGIASLVKVALSLKHREIPPSLHFKQPNPHIPFDTLPLYVQQSLTPWREESQPAFAGVSSFGFGGTNAHVVLEEAPRLPQLPPDMEEGEAKEAYVLPLSARSAQALQSLARKYLAFLAPSEPAARPSLLDICYTASLRRTHYDYRLALVGHSHGQLAEHLAAFLDGVQSPQVSSGHKAPDRQPRLVFVFSGQGAQWLGMGRELLRQEPAFRAILQQCDQLLRQHTRDWSLLDELLAEGSHWRLSETELAQPALFAFQIALVALWRSWGIEPDAVIGHSLGEVAAAYVAGIFSLEDAIRIIFHRSRLMQRVTGQGKMAQVELPLAQVEQVLEGYQDRLCVAAINSPTSTVLSGEPIALAKVLQGLQERQIRCRLLDVDYAFHSYQIEPYQSELEQALQGLTPQRATRTIYSTVTGQASTGEEYDARYWGRNMREPVRFAPAVEALLKEKAGQVPTFIEISPHPVLSGVISQCLYQHGEEGSVLSCLRRDKEERGTLLEALGKCYSLGYSIDWASLYLYGGQHVSLPTYAWQRERYWLEGIGPVRRKAVMSVAQEIGSQTHHPLLVHRLSSPLRDILFWSQMSTALFPFLNDHRIYGSAVFPASAYLEMAQAAAAMIFGAGPHTIVDLILHEALVLPKKDAKPVQFVWTPAEAGKATFQIFSRNGDTQDDQPSWKLHASGAVPGTQNGQVVLAQDHPPLTELQAQCRQELSTEVYYSQLRAHGLEYGASFQGIEQLWRTDGAALGRLRLPSALAEEAGAYRLHPALLDASFQLFEAALSDGGEQGSEATAYLPVGVERFAIYTHGETCLWSHARLRASKETARDTLVGDVHLFDETGQVVAVVEGLRLKRVSYEILQHATQERLSDWLYEVAWQPKERGESVPALESAQTKPGGSWIIFADSRGIGARLARKLETRGQNCIVVVVEECKNKVQETQRRNALHLSEEGYYQVDPSDAEAFQRLFEQVLVNEKQECRGVIHLWSLEAAAKAEMTTAELQAAQVLGCGSVLHLVQALATVKRSRPPRLWLVTRGTQPVEQDPGPLAVAQAPLWGLGRVIALEHPELHCVRLDLDPARESHDINHLMEELESGQAEDQVAFRRHTRYVARLVHSTSKTRKSEGKLPVAGNQPFRLEIPTRGILDNLVFQPAARRQLGSREVELRVHATGLNFRDVLNTLGMYPGDAGPLGGECAGKIVALGPEVKDWQIGDEVIGLAPGSFGTFVITNANLLAPKPAHLTFEQAATIPIAFLTAYYGLHHLAKMSAGDRVLIHAAAGGVGMAAIQLAQQAGAEIFGTAGSPEKREFLKSVGVQHVMNSRSLDFADEIMALTGGQGVDIVLNSLAGEYITKSLAVLGAKGRYLEIGKIGIEDKDSLAHMRSDTAYFAIALDRLAKENSVLVGSLLRKLVERFGPEGDLKPLPHRVFPIEEVVSAFRHMAQAKHIGKIVVSQKETKPSVEKPTFFRDDGTYLITGGLGALGLLVAQWMVKQGVRHLALVGRSGSSGSVDEALRELRQEGARVEIIQADISEEEQAARVLTEISQSMPPLRGIIHSAGILDDGVLMRQQWTRFARVMAPKVEGAWNLHHLTQHLPLEFFVLFSSAASLLGSPGQANYASANAFLDALAFHRRALGLPALSINWGLWSEGGMLRVGDSSSGGRTDLHGMGIITTEQGLQVLGQVLQQESAQVGVMPIKWPKFLQQFAVGEIPPLLHQMVEEADLQVKAGPRPKFLQQLEAAPANRRRNLLIAHIRDQVAKVLGLDPSHTFERGQGLSEMGMDSLMAVELRNRLQGSLGYSLPPTMAFEYPTIEALADSLSKELFPSDEHATSVQPDEQKDGIERSKDATDLEQLSQEEMVALLAEKLAAIDRGKQR